jgi:pimeloyl-ACP methyl ester carboxylesterase
MTIGEMSTPLESFARTHKVIAVELQGHGRTEDIDRPLSFETLGDDIAALLDHLNIASADIVGLSLGAAVGLRTASSIRKRSAGSSSSRAPTPRAAGTAKRRKACERSAPPWPNT